MRAGEIYRDGKIPYQRYRAWELAGKTVGLVGLGAAILAFVREEAFTGMTTPAAPVSPTIGGPPMVIG